mgnify:CR=1 FL=1
MNNRFFITILLAAFPVVGTCPVSGFALDLDDGIEIDDSIDNYHELNKIQNNTTYVVMNAMSSAQISATNAMINAEKEKNDADDSSENSSEESYVSVGTDKYGRSKPGRSGGNSSSINSVDIAAGSTINGDIIIIDNSKGGHTAISQ